MKTTSILLSGLALLAVVFSAVSMVVPWWTIHISPEAIDVLNSDFRIDFNLLKTVSSSYTDNSLAENVTQSTQVAISNLTSTQESSPPSFAFMDTTLQLMGAGLALSTLMVIGTVLTRARKYMKYILIAGYISAALLIIAPIYFAQEMPTQVSSLSSVSPLSIPSGWTTVSPRDITGFWGGIGANPGSQLSTWLQSNEFWVWQSSSGWFLALSAGFLNIIVCLTTRMILKREETQSKGSPATMLGPRSAENPESG